MNPQQDFNKLYTDIAENIAAAMAEIGKLEVEHKDGKQELCNIMERLEKIHHRFDGELKLLEEHAEWEKFTIAFFGETNAGKSTIIESLRILFNEESRKELLQQNLHDLDQCEQVLNSHVNKVRESLNTIYAEYADEIAEIKKVTTMLGGILREESAARIKRKLWFYAFGGASIGATAAVAIAMLLRA